jgi:hypothetical protein
MRAEVESDETKPKATFGIFPEAITNVLETINTAARIIRKSAHGTERVVDGVDKLATEALAQKYAELEAKLAIT